MIDSRNTATTADAQGVLAPLTRIASHIGWCLGYLGTQDEENFGETEVTSIREDLDDAIKHLGDGGTGPLIKVFMGDDGQAQLDAVRADIEAELPTEYMDLSNHLQNINDNIAEAMAIIEKALTGNANASAGRNA